MIFDTSFSHSYQGQLDPDSTMDHDDGDSRDGGKDEWERLGLEKRIDFENLRRVFERLDLKVKGTS